MIAVQRRRPPLADPACIPPISGIRARDLQPSSRCPALTVHPVHTLSKVAGQTCPLKQGPVRPRGWTDSWTHVRDRTPRGPNRAPIARLGSDRPVAGVKGDLDRPVGWELDPVWTHRTGIFDRA